MQSGFLRGYRSRIHLNGDLCILVHMNVSRTASNMENTCARNKEGGSSSYKYAYNMISLCQRPVRTDPLAKAFHILLPLPSFEGADRKSQYLHLLMQNGI